MTDPLVRPKRKDPLKRTRLPISPPGARSRTALGLVATRSSGSDPRGRIALMTVSFSIGQILGPAFAGYVYDATGSLAMPLLTAVAALVLAAVLSLLADARRRALNLSR